MILLKALQIRVSRDITTENGIKIKKRTFSTMVAGTKIPSMAKA